MELTDENIHTLSGYLQCTLSADINVRKPAEEFLEAVEVNKNYPILLLYLIDKQDGDLTIRITGSVAFKNYIKRNWKIEEGSPDRIHEEDRKSIKNFIVDLMLKSPESIQKQLSDAISTIGSHDFPLKWPGLLDQMIQKFSSGEFSIINGVLQTAHSLFKKYRHQFKSQPLWEEIKFVLDRFARPLTELLNGSMNMLSSVKDTPEVKIILSSLILISKIFFSLNYQDLPEFFEDHMETWMSNFLKLLSLDDKDLHSSVRDETNLLEKLKGQICDNITLYAQKYDDEFVNFMPTFFAAIKALLVSIGPESKYDTLVGNALNFLKRIAERHNFYPFRDPAVLSEICHNIVIPNMEFRNSDQELFEDNPEEYIRRDIEGSDVYTRRRAACDLVRALTIKFEKDIMNIFGQYVEAMLSQYAANPTMNWKSKDAACFLVTSLVSRGQTERHGVTQTSKLVNLAEFATNHIFNELARPDVNALPVLKADAIKYVIVFRSVLPKEVVVSCLPELVRHLTSSCPVTHTYAAVAIDKIFLLRASDQNYLVSRDTIAPLGGDLLINLFRVLETPSSSENEYVMKAIMRSFCILQTSVTPFLGDLLPKLTQKLASVARNPSKPHFNHYLFETIGLSIKIVCFHTPEAVTSFEQALFPAFQNILQHDVQEFIPYVFQLLSLLLELQANKVSNIPDAYMALLPCLLAPVLWERSANVKPLVRLLQAALVLGSNEILKNNLLNGLLGIFQKLNASKADDHEGFNLLQYLIEFMPKEAMQPFLRQIFVLIFSRLQSSKTPKFIKCVIAFLGLFAAKYSPKELISIIDSIQAGMFGMVLERVIIQDIRKVNGSIEKKITAVGLIKLLCEYDVFLNGDYSKYWVPVLNAIIGIFELPEEINVSCMDDNNSDDMTDYSPAYSQLAHAQKPIRDPFSDIADPRIFLAQSLEKLAIGAPGRLVPLIGNLGQAEQMHLKRYLQAANIQLS